MSTNALPPFPEGINIVNYTVSPLLGAMLNWGLFGVLSVQVYIYHLNFSDDKNISKVLVYGVYLIEVAQTIMLTMDVYRWFGVGYGNWDYLMNTFTSPFNTPLLCGVVAVIVQSFFAYRIWTIQQHHRGGIIVVGGILITAVIQLVGAIMTAYEAFRLGRSDRFHESQSFTSAYYMWLLGGAISDLLIAGAMLWILYSNRKNNQHSALGTNKLLARLVKLVVETNSLTAGMALASFILFLSLPHTSLFVLTAVVLGKLYANTLLVTFNNRITLRNKRASMNFESHHRGVTPVTFSFPNPNPPMAAHSGFNNRLVANSVGQTINRTDQTHALNRTDRTLNRSDQTLNRSDQTLNRSDQKPSSNSKVDLKPTSNSKVDLNHSTDAFGFREELAHGKSSDVENIQIEVSKHVEVAKDLDAESWRNGFDVDFGRSFGAVSCRCGVENCDLYRLSDDDIVTPRASQM